MNRRNMLYGGAALLAAVAGAGLAWRQSPPAESTGSTGAGAGAKDPFWNLVFDTPDGQSLAMQGFAGKPLLVNFWATWCPPCVEELPLLDRFASDHKSAGWQVVGLAVDQPSAVRNWLQRAPLGFPVGMAGLSGTELSKSLGNLSGALPFTVVFGRSGELLHRKSGKVTPEELAQWAQLG